ncbi:hypothetical protein [Streptomyces sp. NBC_00582]|uniref:hypothetical protein n=1 Tax=Streptomyces sp. NBC_00582 TaxID=2975783 RepID=UPI002E80E831|nr:hypothetical protein [Streptomyces sp. NBC_00582]WUB61527.1 hypothetical protein OG852_14560 [Streptomyces sp. NBC_00582]
MLDGLLRRIARRCDAHDRASYTRTRQLEEAAGMEPGPAPASLADAFRNPDIIDCGNTWCRHRR